MNFETFETGEVVDLPGGEYGIVVESDEEFTTATNQVTGETKRFGTVELLNCREWEM